MSNRLLTVTYDSLARIGVDGLLQLDFDATGRARAVRIIPIDAPDGRPIPPFWRQQAEFMSWIVESEPSPIVELSALSTVNDLAGVIAAIEREEADAIRGAFVALRCAS